MGDTNLKMILNLIHDMIKRNRVAYKDYIGNGKYNIKKLPSELLPDDVAKTKDLKKLTTNLSSDVTNLSSDVTNLSSDVTNLSSDVTNLSSDVTNLSSDVTNLSSDVTNCLKKSGGTMTGSLILANAPSTNMEAATKAYVDLVYGYFKNNRTIGDENNAIYLDSANHDTSLLTTSSAKIELKHGKYKTTGSSAELTEEDPEKLTIYSNGYINSNSKIISFGKYNHGGQNSTHIDSLTAHILRNIATPEFDYDAATKDYVDKKISDTKIVLNSSTSGSTKKFEITVDDSGSLTATEVTTTA